ncbi:ABC transporter substrate-binding protein [Sphaerisporangium krabiense]|uniref:Putative spermidine/putrescine transport system substrate-binding protein n=1 Tax=Sphaerisporangium krabiense TaxID=763782 RepID=A0A7W8Z3A7_9ACTN|nr:ABC transporter substrate-binding protein [Sphaerisporangium krabiense]MBB5626697.1 putative spermidine/putrescine transport system substrate-binding protein [Sphaerisporangium krabiense]GII63616.1 ABC transporter substrate-binding protein [Sphaerisporangium krabiense]
MKFSRKTVLGAVIAAGTLLTTSACGGGDDSAKSASAGSVVVPDPGGDLGKAMKTAFFDPFEKQTGIDVVLSPGEFDAAVVLAGVKAGAPAFDLVNPNGAVLKRFRDASAIEPIDYTQWKDGVRDKISPVKAADDAVPAYYISVQPSWSTAKLGDKKLNSWADFWNVGDFPGKRTLAPGSWGAGGATFEIAAMADGVAPKDLYPIDFDRAFKSLDRLKPDLVKFWETGAEPIQLLTGGQATAASAWNGRVAGAKDKGAPVDGTWNQSILQYDNWAILKGAKNAKNAQKLLAFMMEAGPQAEFAKAIPYSPANSAAFDQLPADRAALLPTSPKNVESAVTQDYEWWTATAPGSDKTNEEVAIERWQAWASK